MKHNTSGVKAYKLKLQPFVSDKQSWIHKMTTVLSHDYKPDANNNHEGQSMVSKYDWYIF